MLKTDIVIIGGGVISLALAYFLIEQKYSVIILEKEKKIFEGASNFYSNSSVIHAGIYYEPNSLKSKLCIRGKQLIYRFCDKLKIRYNKCGKIILAQNKKDYFKLDKCMERALKNGLEDLRELNQNQIQKIEPNLRGFAGLLSPSSGVLDIKSYKDVLENIILSKGAKIITSFEFKKAIKKGNVWEISENKNNSKIISKLIINSAGRFSSQISKKIFPKEENSVSAPVKGLYLIYKKKHPLNKIIYPALEPGVITERADTTPMISGKLLFGPTIEKKNISTKNKKYFKNLATRYTSLIKNYLPNLNEKYISFYSYGLRPKIKIKNKNYNDFFINFKISKRWIDLCGIESPGLTSNLSIGEYVSKKIKETYGKNI